MPIISAVLPAKRAFGSSQNADCLDLRGSKKNFEQISG